MKLRNNLALAGAQDNSQFSERPYELTFSQAMMYGLLKGWFATLRSTVLNADDLQAMLGSGRRFVCAWRNADGKEVAFVKATAFRVQETYPPPETSSSS